MPDDIRTRIAAVAYRHTLFRALDQCECGAAFDGFCGRSLDAWAAHLADAVIAELGLRPERGELSSADGVMWAKDMGFYRCEDDPHTVHRWVTEWQADE